MGFYSLFQNKQIVTSTALNTISSASLLGCSLLVTACSSSDKYQLAKRRFQKRSKKGVLKL